MAPVTRHSVLLMFCAIGLVACASQSTTQLGSAKQSTQFADSIYTNAKVYTVDEQQPWAEAVAIKGAEILAVGSSESMKAHTGPATSIHDM